MRMIREVNRLPKYNALFFTFVNVLSSVTIYLYLIFIENFIKVITIQIVSEDEKKQNERTAAAELKGDENLFYELLKMSIIHHNYWNLAHNGHWVAHSSVLNFLEIHYICTLTVVATIVLTIPHLNTYCVNLPVPIIDSRMLRPVSFLINNDRNVYAVTPAWPTFRCWLVKHQILVHKFAP